MQRKRSWVRAELNNFIFNGIIENPYGCPMDLFEKAQSCWPQLSAQEFTNAFENYLFSFEHKQPLV